MIKENFLQKLKKPQENNNILKKIKLQKIPLIIWGMGSMSYSVRNLLEREEIKIAACWVDNCKEGTVIGDIPVMELEDIYNKFGEINVVCGHSRYELADDIKRKYSFIHEVYCLVNVCYGQWSGISYDFVEAHTEEYIETYKLLADEKSKECMLSYLNCKLNEDYRYLLPCYSKGVSYFENPFFKMTDKEDYVDVGAYNGDSIEEFLKSVNTYHNIYALEPEENSYTELIRYGERRQLKDIYYYPYGTWKTDTILNFNSSEESSGISNEGKNTLQVAKLDTLMAGKRVSLIKINFLNGVEETLEGASDILVNQKPRLIVTVGFDEWGIIKIPQRIKKINPNYNIYLGYAAPMPARLILFAV